MHLIPRFRGTADAPKSYCEHTLFISVLTGLQLSECDWTIRLSCRPSRAVPFSPVFATPLLLTARNQAAAARSESRQKPTFARGRRADLRFQIIALFIGARHMELFLVCPLTEMHCPE